MAKIKKTITEKNPKIKVAKKVIKKTETKTEKSATKASLFQDYLSNIKTITSKRPKMDKRTLGLALVAGLILLIALASRFLVVAWVDKRPITLFEEYKVLEQRYGKDVKEQLIVERLILSEAGKRGVNLSEEDINTEIKKIEKEQGGKDSLSQILKSQGISEEEFRKLVKLQVLREKMFGGNVIVSDEEVNQYMQQNGQQLSAESTDASGAAQVKNNIKDQLKQQKINTEFNNWLKQNLQSSRVVRS